MATARGALISDLSSCTKHLRIVFVAGFARSLVAFRGVLLGQLVSEGHEVYAAAPNLSPGSSIYEELTRLGVRPISVGLVRTGMNPFLDLQTLGSLTATFRRLRPDLVLCYTVKPVIWGSIAARIARVPRRVAMITGAGSVLSEDPSNIGPFVKSVVLSLYRIALRTATTVVFFNRDDVQLFHKKGLLRNGVTASVIPGSGVDLLYFSRQPIPSVRPFRFVMISRLLRDKGVREYLEACQRLRQETSEVECHIAGWLDENPESFPSKEWASMVETSGVKWHGSVDDVRPLLEQCHVYVLPSYREGLPRSVLEAMAVGRAIITTDAPGCRETVVDGVNGALIPPRSADSLYKVMRLMAKDARRVERMGNESRRIAEERFDVHQVNAQLLRVMGVGAS